MERSEPSHENPTIAVAVNRRALVRSAKCADLTSFLSIERNSFRTPWTQADFVSALTAAGCFALVYEDTHHGRVAGYAIVAELGQSLAVLNVAVDPDYRFQGIGTTLIGQLVQCTVVRGPCSIQAVVPDFNVPAQCFFQSLGFRRLHTIRSGGTEDDSQHDAGFFVLQPWRQ
jgi:ribosomal protein S18 acetylase RimI-like enzyme